MKRDFSHNVLILFFCLGSSPGRLHTHRLSGFCVRSNDFRETSGWRRRGCWLLVGFGIAFPHIARDHLFAGAPIGVPVRAMPLRVAAGAARGFPALAILVLIGSMLIGRDDLLQSSHGVSPAFCTRRSARLRASIRLRAPNFS